MFAQFERLTGVFGEVFGGGPVAKFAFAEVGVELVADAGVEAVLGVARVDPFAALVEAFFVGEVVTF